MFANFAKSILVGMGAIAPGLSGGTLAIILGLYEQLITAISNLLRKPVASIRFLLPVGAGAVVGIVAFSTVQKLLLGRYLMQTMFGFMGLIIGSLPFLFREANEQDPITRENAAGRVIPFAVTLLIGLALTILDTREIDVAPVVVAMGATTFLRLLLVGVLIAGSLVIPGISGTVLLVMIGQYGLVLNAVADLRNILRLPVASPEMIQGMVDNILVLIPLGLGAAAGVFLFSRLMTFLFSRWHGPTYAGILGFVVGSIPALYPQGANLGANGTTVVSILLLLVGIFAAYWFSRLSNNRRPPREELQIGN
jgi:putative membrane protein